MKDIFEQLNERAKNISLSAEEKQGIRARLVSFAQAHPVRNHVSERHIPQIEKKLWLTVFSRHPFILNLRPMFIALIIALVLGGSTAFAAENSLPGDTLYPVKVYVNEQVRDALEVSDKGQAEWDLKKAERRLLEAEKLAQQGKLNAIVRSDIEARIKTNIDNAIELRDHDSDTNRTNETKDTLTANLGALVRAHGDILKSILSRDLSKTTRSELESILSSIRTHATTTVSTSTSSDDDHRDLGTAGSAAGKLQAAEHKLAEVQKFISSKLGGSVNTSTTGVITSLSIETKARTLLQQAVDLIAQGKIKVDVEAYHEAFNLFQSSMELSQEAKILVATAHELKINLRDDQEENDRGDDQGDDRNEKNTTSTDFRRQDEDKKDENENKNIDEDKDENKDEDQLELKVKVESREGNDSIRVKLDD